MENYFHTAALKSGQSTAPGPITSSAYYSLQTMSTAYGHGTAAAQMPHRL